MAILRPVSSPPIPVKIIIVLTVPMEGRPLYMSGGLTWTQKTIR